MLKLIMKETYSKPHTQRKNMNKAYANTFQKKKPIFRLGKKKLSTVEDLGQFLEIMGSIQKNLTSATTLQLVSTKEIFNFPTIPIHIKSGFFLNAH